MLSDSWLKRHLIILPPKHFDFGRRVNFFGFLHEFFVLGEPKNSGKNLGLAKNIKGVYRPSGTIYKRLNFKILAFLANFG